MLRRRNGATIGRLNAGETILIGRAPAADVVLPHPSVSRLHARIRWPQGRTRPVIEDLHSQNGVWLDGRRIAQVAELRDGVRLGLGELELCLDLVEDAPPALLEESGDTVRVRLFSEAGPALRGRLSGARQLRHVLLDIEHQRRTGTLVLADLGQVTFARGRIVDAVVGAARGRPALDALLAWDGAAAFHFDLDVAARECGLSVAVRDLLRGDATETERVGREGARAAS